MIHLQGRKIGILINLRHCNAIWLWVEDEVPAFAFPTHWLVVGVAISSCIGNIRD